jgi:hypothetical protein
MATEPIIKTVAQLVAEINTRLADNNSGEIGASDVREPLRNVAASIPYIIASGAWDVPGKQFIDDVELIIHTVQGNQQGGTLVVHSGIVFQTPDGNGERQTIPYPGVEGIEHNDLAGLGTGDPHTQYLSVTSTRDIVSTAGGSSATNSLGLGANNWIRERGVSVKNTAGDRAKGFRFEHTGLTTETVHVGSGTKLYFDKDSSEMSSARSTAKAWISFSSVSGALGNPVAEVYSSYGVKKLQRIEVNENGDGVTYVPQAGKFKIWFNDGLFDSGNDYLAIGTSNARSSQSSGADFELNTVCCVERTADYCTFFVLDDQNAPRDAEINDLVIFGIESGATYSDSVTVVSNHD